MGELVSIIVPVYNTEKYIEKCIKSILEQTYKNIELILVNDGSEQKEEAIIKKYAEYDRRIRYIKNQKNQGLFLTRISGVRHAAGKYLMFVDSDDYISFDFVRLLVEEAEKEDSDITFSTTVLNTPKEKKVIDVFQNTALYRLPLSGENVRKAFFEQGGTAYVWHTIWNKLYKKELWDRCLPYFEKLDKHVVMTEDLAFSCVLFYFAKKVARAENSVYFYCQHSEASTSSSRIHFLEYKKKVTDISTVFGFLEDFFRDKGEWYRDRILEFRQYYARLWRRGIVNIIDGNQNDAETLITDFCKNPGDGTVSEDGYFNQAQAPYSDRLDEIKKQIWSAEKQYVSFDVFDTVVTRPFFTPSDLFWLLDDMYDEACSNTSFHTIRMEGEEGCRRKLCDKQKEDVTIDEIYLYISETYGIPMELCLKIKKLEEELEVSFSQNRKAGHEIYDVALLSGKKVIFTSDMYLRKETIAKLLEKNNYDGYEEIFVSSGYGKLKATGKLFRQAAQALHIELKDMIHIGDNPLNDVEAPESLGVTAIYFPKACDVFEGRVPALKTNGCFAIGKRAAGIYVGQKGFERISGYGCMAAMVANRYFDNPFRYFHPMTDLNMDAFLAGYYVLGMNLAAQIHWVEKARKKKGAKRIIFTARDGYLLKQAYDYYLEICGENVKTEYRYVSRKAMLPLMLEKKADFMNLPIVYTRYTPDMLLELLSFCVSDSAEAQCDKAWEKNKINRGKTFRDISEYHKFIQLFLEDGYNALKHEKHKERIRSYWSGIKDTDMIYDMGYSGSIHNAIASASGTGPAALFIHTDQDRHVTLERRNAFTIESMLGSIPNISGLMREYFFSDAEHGSCIGYQEAGGKVVPVLETEQRKYVDQFPLQVMQEAAVSFVKDFYGLFHRYLPYLDIQFCDIQMPFEGFLCSPSKMDTKVFMASYFEDKVYGAAKKLNVRDFWLQLLAGQPGYRGADIASRLEEYLQEKGKKELAFFGTGRMCRDILEANPSISVSVFLDNDADKNGQSWYGKTILLPSEAVNIRNYYIIIVCAAYMEIEEQLEDMGLMKFEDFVTYMEIF